MSTLLEFLRMGGYGPYIWPCYGLTALVLLLNVLIPWWRERDFLRRLAIDQVRKRS